MRTVARPVGSDLEFFDDPAAFLAVAGEHLAAAPVVSTVVATLARREADAGGPSPVDRPHWFVVARDDDGGVAGVAMRTAPFFPHPLFVLPMPAAAARGLAQALHARGEHVAGVNGALPAARVLGDELARLQGGRVEVAMHTRLLALGGLAELVVPPPPPGRARLAEPADAALLLRWFHDFHRAADEQAGREHGHDARDTHVTPEEIAGRIADGRLLLWEDEGEPVHLTGVSTPSFGVARIGPVYTPRERRGRGYASATVADASRRLLAAGARPCLFTDRANPTSNHVYEALGFRPVVDMVDLAVTG